MFEETVTDSKIKRIHRAIEILKEDVCKMERKDPTNLIAGCWTDDENGAFSRTLSKLENLEEYEKTPITIGDIIMDEFAYFVLGEDEVHDDVHTEIKNRIRSIMIRFGLCRWNDRKNWKNV